MTNAGLFRCDGRKRDQETFGEQLAFGEQERDESGAESDASEKVVFSCVQHGQVCHDADPDLEAPEEARDQYVGEGPMQPLGTLVDGPVKGLLNFFLNRAGVLAKLTAPGVAVPVTHAGYSFLPTDTLRRRVRRYLQRPRKMHSIDSH